MDMFRHPLLCRWIVNLSYSWFATSLGYYVLSTSSASVTAGLNFYLEFCLLAIIEIPFIFMLTFSMKYVGRKVLLVSTLIICGVVSLSELVIPGSATQLVCAIIAKGFISATFSLVYIYTAEVFPTALRSSGVGICSLFARIATIVSKFVTGPVCKFILQAISKI